MRRYSDSERSSALARRDSARSRRGETRSLISSVHFSFMVGTQKNAGPGSDARPASKPRMVTGEGGRRENVAGTSGGLLFLCWRIEHIRARQLQIHQASVRDAVFTPLRNGCFRDFAQLGDLYCAAEAIDDLAAVEFHAQSIGNYTAASQAKLTQISLDF